MKKKVLTWGKLIVVTSICFGGMLLIAERFQIDEQDCLSTADTELKHYVQRMMTYPASFEYISTVISPVDQHGKHEVLMKYRSQAGFGGGPYISTAKAIILQSDCSYTALSF